MLARPDALHLVCWTCAGISGTGRREVHDILVVWNGAGRNSISIFGPRNAQRSNAIHTRGLANDLTRFLGSMYGGVPLDSFRHGAIFVPTSRRYKLRFLQFTFKILQFTESYKKNHTTSHHDFARNIARNEHHDIGTLQERPKLQYTLAIPEDFGYFFFHIGSCRGLPISS
jgi:hypothetical protein